MRPPFWSAICQMRPDDALSSGREKTVPSSTPSTCLHLKNYFQNPHQSCRCHPGRYWNRRRTIRWHRRHCRPSRHPFRRHDQPSAKTLIRQMTWRVTHLNQTSTTRHPSNLMSRQRYSRHPIQQLVYLTRPRFPGIPNSLSGSSAPNRTKDEQPLLLPG